MRGYDDAPAIARIRADMAANPSLSRRAAIIAVSGETNLRRIERKMQREDNPSTLAGNAAAARTPAPQPQGEVVEILSKAGSTGQVAAVLVNGRTFVETFDGPALTSGARMACTFAGDRLALLQDLGGKTTHTVRRQTSFRAYETEVMMLFASVCFFASFAYRFFGPEWGIATGIGLLALGALPYVSAARLHMRRRHLLAHGFQTSAMGSASP